MDKSRPLPSQARSFLFLCEPIRASTEKACARELRATAERLLSLILAARRGCRSQTAAAPPAAELAEDGSGLAGRAGPRRKQSGEAVPT